MIWEIDVPVRPAAREQPPKSSGTDNQDAYKAAIAVWRAEQDDWAKQIAAIDAIAQQPIKAVHSITDIGGGSYLANVDIDIAGKIERLDYCYALAASDTAKAHVQLVGLHQKLTSYIRQSAPLSKSELLAYAGEVGWRIEVAGKTISNVAVRWDDRSKVLLMGAAGTLSDEAIVDYVSGSAVVSLTGAQIKSIYAAMVGHTRACFAKRVDVFGRINSGTITTKAEIDAAYVAL